VRFYTTATQVLLHNDGLIDKFVGDEVVGFFMPFMTGPDHAGAAVRAAQELLHATGHAEGVDPWLPLAAGVNTGTAFVGMVSKGRAASSRPSATPSTSPRMSSLKLGPVRSW
jgi:adenylate cyclase